MQLTEPSIHRAVSLFEEPPGPFGLAVAGHATVKECT